MKQNLKKILSLSLLVVSAFIQADTAQNFWAPRAFSSNLAAETLSTKQAYDVSADAEGFFGTLSMTTTYEANFHGCKNLGVLPFWSGTNSMTVGTNDGLSNFDGRQFGLDLPTGATTTVSLDPKVYQVGVDFAFALGAHKTERGFFFNMHAPIGLISIDPKFAYSSPTTEAFSPSKSMADVWMNSKDSTWALSATLSLPYKQMKYGLMSTKRNSSVKFGDAEFTIGYNVMADECKHVGVGFKFSAPTGNKTDAVYVLDTVFGNNGRWTAGLELTGSYKVWEADSNHRSLNLLFDASLRHLFNSKHMRSFDLKANGAGSKYLLVAKYDGTAFQNEVMNAINLTTLQVHSSYAAEGAAVMALDFQMNCMNFVLGYEFWGRTEEKLKLVENSTATAFNSWAIMGNQFDTTKALCQPTATISKSDAQATAAAGAVVDAKVAANRLTSVVTDLVDVDGQKASGIYTHKAFGQAQYTWHDVEYKPYLALNASAQVPGAKQYNAIKSWSIGLQGGISF